VQTGYYKAEVGAELAPEPKLLESRSQRRNK
jgi:hypothetical protein